MLHYIIQTIAFQLFFLIVYDVFLKRETFFNWNRMYLLATAILSLILPFIKISSFKEVVPQNYIISLPEVILGQPQVNSNNVIPLQTVVVEQNATPIWQIIFYTGLFVACGLFLFKLFKIVVLILKNPTQSIGNIVLVELLNSTAAFSFFHYIFLGEKIKAKEKEAILKHELIHTKQKHTFDLLFFELLRIVFWFNPFVYMYQNRIRTLHEFIADANAVKHQDKNEYYQNLLSQVFETRNISFINPFFHQSLIKKRIVMLSKTKSKQIHLIKYALLIPLVFGMLIYTSAEAQEKVVNKKQDLSQYSYTLKKGEELIGDKKKIYEKYENFLKSNKDYVSWAQINREDNTISYSVHHIDKNVPEFFSKSEVSFPDGSSYIAYLNWEKPDKPKELSAEEKKKKVKEFLKLNEEYKNAVEVPFAVIDQVPVFPGCENLTKEEQKQCFSNNVAKLVNKNFNTKLANKLGLTGRQRINVIFKIDEGGSVVGIKSRAPHQELEDEAIRVVKTLPKMIPGKHKGENVVVPYSLPIIFQVDNTAKNKQTIPAELEDEIEVPFAVIENVPTFPGCEEGVNAQKKKCMSDKISRFVAENFNTKIANKLELEGRQRINVIFKINEEGYITGVRSRAAHPALETEAIRVISLLPKMKPGMQKGKAVTVPYSLPIVFEVKDKQVAEKITKINHKQSGLDETTMPFAIVDKVPVLPECEALQSEKEKRECTSKGVQKFVTENFNTKLASQLGLKGRQRINVIFKITKKGNIAIEKSRASHPDLELEAIRVIKSIPKLIPGEHKGKKVDVLYSIPIVFQVKK